MATFDIARLRRQAQNLRPHGPLILELLIVDDTVRKLVLAAELGMPPVAMVSEILPPTLHPALDEDAIRRFIGTVIAAILSAEGLVVDRTGVRVSNADSPFSRGAIYVRRPADSDSPPAGNDDLLDAMIANLSAAQRQALIERIQALGTQNQSGRPPTRDGFSGR
jgi:hypothetical protein